MLSWFTGSKPENDYPPKASATEFNVAEENEGYQGPTETPAHRFMLGALRTAVLGTPGPPKAELLFQPQFQPQYQPPVQREEKPEFKTQSVPVPDTIERLKPTSYNSSRLEDAEDIPRFNSNRFHRRRKTNEDFQITGSSTPPLRRTASTDGGLSMSPTKKGILMTPGTIRAKKSVAWCPSTPMPEGDKKEVKNRTGIPDDCPGKFPSPWAPRVKGMEGEETPDVGAGKSGDPHEKEVKDQMRSLRKSMGEEVTPDGDRKGKLGIGKSWMDSQDKPEPKRASSSIDSRSAFKPLPSLASGSSDERAKKLQEKVEDLNSEIRVLKAKLRDFDKYKSQNDRMTKANMNALDRIAELEGEKEAFVKQLQEADEKLAESRSRIRKLERGAKEHDQKMNELSVLFDESGMHDNIKQLTESKDLKAELRAAKRSLDGMEKLKRENEELRRKVETLDKSVEKLQGEKASMQSELVQMLSSQPRTSKSAETMLRADNERLLEENHRLRMENLDKEKKIRQADRTINTLQDQTRQTEKSVLEKTPKTFNLNELDNDPFLAALSPMAAPSKDRKQSLFNDTSLATDQTAIKAPVNSSTPKDADPASKYDLRSRNLHSDFNLLNSPARPSAALSPRRRSPRKSRESSPIRRPVKDSETLDNLDFNTLMTSTPNGKSKPSSNNMLIDFGSDKENTMDRPYSIPSPKRSVLPMAYSPGNGYGNTRKSLPNYSRAAPSAAKRGARASTGRSPMKKAAGADDVVLDKGMSVKERLEARRRARAAARG